MSHSNQKKTGDCEILCYLLKQLKENCFVVCKSNFCSSRQRDYFYTTSQVLYVLLRDRTVPKCSLATIALEKERIVVGLLG